MYLATVGEGDEAGLVAVKVLQQGLDARGQAVERLRDEARLLHLLDHPNILEVHDLIGVSGRVALMTEYLEGQDVEDLLLPPHTLPMSAGMQVMAKVATALQAAYTTMGPRGEPLRLLHRDIKPGNIRLGPDGSVKVLDFGIAKASGVTREAKTQATSVVGSFAYMAPERFRPREAGTPRGDVYSIAAVLFEVLSAGRMLYEGYELRDLFSLAMMPTERMAVVDRQLGTLAVPPDVRDLLRECVVEAPEERPDLVTLASRLEDLSFDTPGLMLPAWAAERVWPPAPSEQGDLSGKNLPYQSLGVQSRRRVTKHGAPTPPPVASLPLAPHSKSFSSAETIRLVPHDTPVPPPPSLMAASITPVSSPARESGGVGRSVLGFMVLFGVAVGVLCVSIVVGVVGTTSYLAEPVESEPASNPPIVVPRLPTEQPNTQPTPTPTPPPTPSPTPVPLELSKPVAPSPAPAPLAALTVPAVCADLFGLGERAENGDLSAAERECLAGVMRDARFGKIDRTMHGMVLLDDAWARCEAGGGCADYDTSAAIFLGSVDQSDQRRVLQYARHLLRTAENQPTRLRSAAKWAARVLEKEPSATAHETHARALYQVFAIDSSGNNAAPAVKATAGWASFLRGRGADATEAVELCRSAGGEQGTCAPS